MIEKRIIGGDLVVDADFLKIESTSIFRIARG